MRINNFIKKIKLLKTAIFHNSSGFTLFEVLVGIAVSSLILMMVYTSHSSLTKSVHQVTGIADFYENVNLTLGRIDKDISCAYFNRENKNITLAGNSNYEFPYKGKLDFVTVDHKEFSILSDPGRPYPKSDIKEIGYSLKPDDKIHDLYFLIRREERHFDSEPDSGGEYDVLLENVVDLRFEFRKGNDWTNIWDSKENNTFPKIIKTTLKIRNYNSQEEEFVVISKINMDR
ncbi:MAG: prepilin-type N-terminal cleavage/methylation domain-containing protein [Spirochaetes bacterium]|nr:prepilin-type N-terminal cleavage/methylation domain-containing protein [Spirochaetota bacterium]